MSDLINPRTGSSFTQKKQADEMAQIFLAIRHLAARIDAITNQQINMGLYTEYLTEKLLSLTDADGNPVLPVDMNDFPQWAQNRLDELKKEHETAMQEAAAAQENLPTFNLDD